MRRDTAAVLLGGLGIGAGLALLLDPASGRKRRALVRDRLVHATHGASGWARASGARIGNRAGGAIASMRARVRSVPVSDEVLRERVRANLGHVLRHVDRVEVSVEDGCVHLRGALAPHEVPRVIARVWKVPGVVEVRDHLEISVEQALADVEDTTDEMVATARERALRIAGYSALVLVGIAAASLAATRPTLFRAAAVRGAQHAKALLERRSRSNVERIESAAIPVLERLRDLAHRIA